MKSKCFAIYDRKSNLYSQPFHSHNKATAQREFAADVAKEGSPRNRNPEDYDLYELGEYDMSSGEMTSLDKPVHVGHATDYIESAQTR